MALVMVIVWTRMRKIFCLRAKLIKIILSYPSLTTLFTLERVPWVVHGNNFPLSEIGNMGINLSCSYRRMSEKGLDNPDISSVFN